MRRKLYEIQRGMRARREAALKRGVIAVLDIGSSKVACLVLQFVPGEPDADGRTVHGVFRVIGAANTRSRGVRFGEIAEMEETERAVMTAIQAAQKMANIRVDHVIVGFSGGRPRSYGVTGAADVDGSAVRERDIGEVLAACELPDYGADREVIHALPVNFVLDGRTGLTDPRGQVGRRLEVDMHLLTVGATAIQTVLHCVRRCDLEVAGIVCAPYAAGLAALVEDEQELGAACIDLGGGATGISIFVRRQMIYADTVRMGGAHVTSDI
ncbi:MAG TPA: cell division protein FtsA, partial [Paracoccaceae bacterium]|nr:cell division protein FtsA [Paracoccaceae bacterium]